MKTLYVSRKLINGIDLQNWAKSEGFLTTLDPYDMHVTVAFSRNKVDWDGLKPKDNMIFVADRERSMDRFGLAVVMKFFNLQLYLRWKQFIDYGCSWDFDNFQSHITISYNKEININNVSTYKGPLIFGPEIFKEVDLSMKGKINEV